MTNIKEEERKLEAKGCNNCLDWHHHCKSECCKMCYIYTDPNKLREKGKYLIINKILNKDLQRYYLLKGVRYTHGKLHFPKEYCFVSGNAIIYTKACSLLDGFLCLGHPEKKPVFCQDFILDTAKEGKGVITPNCLYKYKLMEEDSNGKKESEDEETI